MHSAMLQTVMTCGYTHRQQLLMPEKAVLQSRWSMQGRSREAFGTSSAACVGTQTPTMTGFLEYLLEYLLNFTSNIR